MSDEPQPVPDEPPELEPVEDPDTGDYPPPGGPPEGDDRQLNLEAELDVVRWAGG